MRRENLKRAAVLGLVLAGVLVPALAQAAAKEYFTEDEIDYIRQAQGIEARAPAIIRLANIRLVALKLKEKSKEDRDLEKRIGEIHKEYEATYRSKAPARPPVVESPLAGPYLNDFSRLELLRGYIEALGEIRTNIDEAYRANRAIRNVVEQFEKFCSTAIPALRRFQASNDAELQAITDARFETQESMESAQEALKIVPKTEKSGKP